ncbi:hypothetical protein [Burkholderia sp. WSM2230]|uniref:hypothetical protein n=1 Tax=Burkholderia sp. WSM2230 TaxID=944435 RepID=UPI0004025EB3|nr:hypothetical protein [Burkholderia sp. WSM2230]
MNMRVRKPVGQAMPEMAAFVRKLGLASLLTAALAPAAFGAGGARGPATYSEIWNPPEARATAPHKAGNAHKLAVRRHVVLRARPVNSRRTSATAPGLVAKQGKVLKHLPKDEPDMSEIPRQITPEGNVLRVTGRAAAVQVMR